MAAIPLALCAVGGDNKSQADLQVLGRYWVQNAIQGVPGAMAPTVMGGKTREAIVYLDPHKLARYNFSPVQVMNKLERPEYLCSGGGHQGRPLGLPDHQQWSGRKD